MLKIRLILALSIALVSLYSGLAFSDTTNFTIRHNDSSTTTTTISPLAVTTSAATEIQHENWNAEYGHKLVLIPMDGLVIPVEIEKPTISLASEQGRFYFSDGQARAVTRTAVVNYDHTAGSTLNYRPTLFISICGFAPEATADGAWNCNWQFEMDKRLKKVLPDYQYKHFAVDWDSHATNKAQVHDLADVVKDFLSSRANVWDVVIVGHSRGGIFAHDLTREIVGHAKIKNMHTFLLDPTASGSPLNDIYPAKKHEASPTIHYGSLYYDNDKFIDGVTEVGTIGDIDIRGYNNYGRNNHYFNSSHAAFADNWIASTSYGFERALIDIKSKKVPGSFPIDGSSGMEIVKISRPDGISFDGDIYADNGNIRIWGELSIASLPGSSVSIDAMVGKDGIEVAGATGVAAAHLIINQDMIYVSTNTLVGSYTASISSDGIAAEVNITVITVGASIDTEEFYIKIDLGPVEVDASGSVLDIIFPGWGLGSLF